jgi:hypothetical protein
VDLMTGPLAAAFQPAESWATWRVALKAAHAIPLTPSEHEVYATLAGGRPVPTSPVREVWAIVGRGGGKSRIAALEAVYASTCLDWSPTLAPGERGAVRCLSATLDQADVVRGYTLALLRLLEQTMGRLIESETDREIVLTNGLVITTDAATTSGVRGFTDVLHVCDELAFWRTKDGGSNPDREVLTALRGARRHPASRLVVISTPYSRRGELWRVYLADFAKDSPTRLVLQASTQLMNPSVDPAQIEQEYRDDPEATSAERGGLFRKDIETFVTLEVLDACTLDGVYTRPPVTGTAYVLFVDPSGGSGADSYAWAIGHTDPLTGRTIIDMIGEKKPPYSPEAVAQEVMAVATAYGITHATGDHVGGEWHREPLRRAGLASYERSPLAKSDLFLNMLPALNSGTIEMLDHEKLRRQLVGLERRATKVVKAPGGHDDVANVVAGVHFLCQRARTTRSPEVEVRAFGPGMGEPVTAADIEQQIQQATAYFVVQRAEWAPVLAQWERDAGPDRGALLGKLAWAFEQTIAGRMARARLETMSGITWSDILDGTWRAEAERPE